MISFDTAKIHEAALTILEKVGVVFHSRDAVDIFQHHGIKTDGNYVFIGSHAVQKALDSAPSEFRLQARNPEKSMMIGSGQVAFAPGYGAPHIMTPAGKKETPPLRITAGSAA